MLVKLNNAVIKILFFLFLCLIIIKFSGFNLIFS